MLYKAHFLKIAQCALNNHDIQENNMKHTSIGKLVRQKRIHWYVDKNNKECKKQVPLVSRLILTLKDKKMPVKGFHGDEEHYKCFEACTLADAWITQST